MTRGEAIARALHWAAFGARPNSAVDWIAYWATCDKAPFSRNAPIATVGAASITIQAETAVTEMARCEKTKLKGMVYRALKTWAIRHGALEYFPTMRQMYRDELARLTQEAT